VISILLFLVGAFLVGYFLAGPDSRVLSVVGLVVLMVVGGEIGKRATPDV
jgi:hypothetical protein